MESTSVRAARIRARTASERARDAPSATWLTWLQESARSRRICCGIVSGGRGPGGLRMSTPFRKIIPIPLQFNADVAGTADGPRLAQRDAHPGNAEVAQNEHGDVLGESFDQMKLRSLHEGQHPLRDPLVIDRILDRIGQCSLPDIGADFDIDDNGLLDLPFPVENTDDGLGFERMYEDLVHYGALSPVVPTSPSSQFARATTAPR